MTPISCHCLVDRHIQIDAHVFGEWAAHPGIAGEDLELRLDWWVVTHVPSGRCILSSVGQLSEVEAIELARVLGERLPPRLVPPMPADGSFVELPLDVRRRIRSVIFDVRGEVLS